MQWLIILGVGLVCTLIARVVLITSAFRVSWAWGLGVLVPFGPMLFRMKYPEDARRARPFQLAALPCFLLYLFVGPGASLPQLPWAKSSEKEPFEDSTPARGYALEKPAPAKSGKVVTSTSQKGPTVEERQVANTKELERLALKDKELKTRKRDLLHSDVQGQAAYQKDLAEYSAALAKANAEKGALEAVGK